MLKLYNTLTRKKESFKPLNPGEVKIYTCGPTVYNYAHIGNLSAYLFSDLLKRYLRYSGYKVIDVMNVTDVDDKTIKASQANNQPLREYTTFFIKELLEDFKKLNIQTPRVLCRATDHIKEMIGLVKKLVENNIAYVADDGSVYYKISKFGEYGKFARLKKDELKNEASGRVSNDEYKKDEAVDFVLWKKRSEKDGPVFWDSPFGQGRPGWHIECSAMSMNYLGDTFDIHTGGMDLIFPHHQNEIAQSEGATGKRFVRYWLHRGFLKIDSEKMSKSLGNIYILKEVLEKVPDPLAFRYLVVTSNYRLGLNFTFKSLKMASISVSRFQNTIKRLTEIKDGNENSAVDKKPESVEKIIKKSENNFKKYMDDNLNASKAIADLFDFSKKVNSLIDRNQIDASKAKLILEYFKRVNEVWGFLKFEEEKIDADLEKEIKALIKKRDEFRSQNDWDKADKIRDQLVRMGVEIKDSDNGTKWEYRGNNK